MEILTKTPATTDQVPTALDQPDANVLRPSQISEYEHDMRIAEQQLADPRVSDKGAVRKRLQVLKENFNRQAPRPLTDGALKDKLWQESKDLLEKITPGMLSAEEMRKNPPGAVDRHMRWERAKKPLIKRWKKIMSVLNADNSPAHTWDRDAANLEKFRPVSAQDRLRTDAQIGGVMSYGSITEENWARVFGFVNPENSALEQVKRVSPFSEEDRAHAEQTLAKHTTPEVVPSDAVVKAESAPKKGK